MVTDLKTRKDASTLKQYRHAWDWTCDNVIGPLFLAALCLMSLLLLTGFMEPCFGFAGLTVDETIHSIGGWLRGFQLPYLMPHVWHAMLALAFAVGGVIGCAIAVWMLAIRGLI